MTTKPKGFNNKIEDQLINKQICSEEILAKYSVKEKNFYFNQFYICAVGRRGHPHMESASSIYSSERRKYIPSAERFSEMKNDFKLFEQVSNHLAGKFSDGYIVTKLGYEVFSESCNSIPKGCGVVDESNRPYNPPRNGIRSRMREGRKCDVKEIVPNEIVINELALHRLMKELKKSGDNDHKIAQIEYILSIARANKSGHLPITYVQSDCGRFYAENAINLQNCSREIRKAALAGFYDIDIENCHYTLLSQMCSRINVPTPCIDDYIANKKLVREHVAELFDISEDDAKMILIALIYGSNLSPCAVLKKLDVIYDSNAIKGSFINKLCKEINSVRKNVINDYKNRTKGHFKILNDAGLIMKTKVDKNKNVKQSKLLAHILQGAESFILQHMIRFMGDNIILLQHDGVTCKNTINADELSKYIYANTGYHVSFDVEQLPVNIQCVDDGSDYQFDSDDILDVFAA
ncbi:hypothetical protein IG611_05040 [Pectobacterium sp. A535-S3-A17]|uniref:hypothetical protein n=1 Tax=Pectobacterium quasiaquaticum TaxID=2774015 RepID=UPI001876CC51|nr:hypothetical protein [Pectobacterium quasiaquaticum]MBE5214704.1 hypothetical protein [Pectobacterium quasiaquaticum]MBE5224743.1 hypothetical protein [Pectobacterium quasiaquaticum]